MLATSRGANSQPSWMASNKCLSPFGYQQADGKGYREMPTTELIDLSAGEVRKGPRLPLGAMDGCAAHYEGSIYWIAGYTQRLGPLAKVFRANGKKGEVQTTFQARNNGSPCWSWVYQRPHGLRCARRKERTPSI